MGYRMIDEHVAREIKDLDTLIRHDMESLARLVRRESAVFPTRMPVRIDHRAT